MREDVVGPGDLHVDEFVRILHSLEPHLPISDAYERDCPQLRGAWWTSQQEHMVRWFSSQNTLGSGAFTRSSTNVSARTTYNRLLAPAAFVWMADGRGAGRAPRERPSSRRRCSYRAEPAQASGLLRKHLGAHR